mmetsp:Transcript_54540/g.177275  ORF Transcript_54540/g.177275 Transcript_54540/m.177275 type:complete len:709 (+) Transcript_54540:67-2193(+)
MPARSPYQNCGGTEASHLAEASHHPRRPLAEAASTYGSRSHGSCGRPPMGRKKCGRDGCRQKEVGLLWMPVEPAHGATHTFGVGCNIADTKTGAGESIKQWAPARGLWRLRTGGVLMAMAGLPGIRASDHHQHHNSTQSRSHKAVQERSHVVVTTADLSKADVARRNVKFTLFFGGGAALLGALGAAAVYKKHGRIGLGLLELVKGEGVLWNGKVVACGKTHTYIQMATDEASGSGVADLGEAAGVAEAGNAEGKAANLVPEKAASQAENNTELKEQLLGEQRRQQHKHEAWMRKRRFLLSGLFVSYVGASVGIPILRAGDVSCKGGFFWEDHVPFFGLFCITKIAELAIYAFDPTIQGDLSFLDFMMKFLPSFLGYLDGYTDATAISIAHSCDDSPIAQNLSIWMCGTYFAGVIVGQWIVVWHLAMKDETHACLMKLIHMDALASGISLPDDSKQTWFIVNMARTFGEDIPQAFQQTLFLIYVKQNYFMIVSVAVSVASSVKALHDAVSRASIAAGAKVTEAQGRIVVAWHVTDHAEGEFFDNLADAQRKYDVLNGGQWAVRLYDEDLKVLSQYGSMGQSKWAQLDDFANTKAKDAAADLSAYYVVVLEAEVVLRTIDLDAAKSRLQEYYGQQQPERLIVLVENKKVVRDGEHGLPARYGAHGSTEMTEDGKINFWWGEESIKNMNDIAQVDVDTNGPPGTHTENQA